MAGPAAPAPAPPRQRMSPLTIVSFGVVFLILFNQPLRLALGTYAGYVLEPVVGFGGHYPILTILICGVLVLVSSTLARHFTTDWLEMARTQAGMRHFQRELMKARKENNTYKIKALTDLQPEVMARQQKLQTAQFKQMPLTMLVSVPVFTWLYTWLPRLDYTWFAAPWNVAVEMFSNKGILFGTSLFPHWILLSLVLTYPLGFVLQRSLKYLAWKERWQKRHPEVHE
jgi:uncharacterized membrane protein (DUF106 family)